MAVRNATGVRSRADHPGRIAPSHRLTPADEAAHRAASFVRPSANTSICPVCGATFSGDNHTCSGLSPDGQAVPHDLTARLGLAAATADGIAEYEAWARGVAA